MSKPDDAGPRRLLVVAPNWLGDAVMSLPLLADLTRGWPGTAITVAARAPLADLFGMTPGVHGAIALEGRGGLTGAIRGRGAADRRRLAEAGVDAALVLPNSFHAAWLVYRARIPERWGYRGDLRSRLLTRPITRPAAAVHQSDYYQALGIALGLRAGPSLARVVVPDADRERAQSRLDAAGLATAWPFVAIAPGAAYGRAKQWLPERVAELARLLASERQTATVLVGSSGDRAACHDIARRAGLNAATLINLAGQTSLRELAGILSLSAATVSNDSGAMHLAAAVGAPVVAVFGPTDERRTSPLAATSEHPLPTVIAADVFCRRCMLRECPIDHRCMSRISARSVLDALTLVRR